jgi:hypothetical protein
MPELEPLASGYSTVEFTGSNTERPELGGCVFRIRVGVRGAPVGTATV